MTFLYQLIAQRTKLAGSFFLTIREIHLLSVHFLYVYFSCIRRISTWDTLKTVKQIGDQASYLYLH